MSKASETLNLITSVFRNIGHTQETVFADLSSKEAVAHEYIVAKTLARLANKRLELAEIAAIKSGIIGDETKLVKGQEVTVWKPRKVPPPLIITARTSNDRQPMIDKVLLNQELSRRFSQKVVTSILEKSSKDVAPTVVHSIVFF